MAAVVDIDNGHGLSIYRRHGNYPDKSKLALYKPLLHCSNHFKPRQSASVLKVGMVDIDVHILSHLKEELAWTVDKWLQIICYVFKNSKSTKELKKELNNTVVLNLKQYCMCYYVALSYVL